MASWEEFWGTASNVTTAQPADQTTSSCLSKPSQFASLTPQKTKYRNFPRFAFYREQGLLFCQQDRSSLHSWSLGAFNFFYPCWKVLPPIPGHGNYPSITPLCWSVLHRHVIPPLLSHQREWSVLGSGSAADSQQLPRGWWIHRLQLNSTALWHH